MPLIFVAGVLRINLSAIPIPRPVKSVTWDAVITQLRPQQVVLVAPAASGPAAIDWALPNPSVLRGLRY